MHLPRTAFLEQNPLHHKDDCVRSHQNSSITKKTPKKGFYAFPLPPLQIAAGVIKDTTHPADISQKRNVWDIQ